MKKSEIESGTARWLSEINVETAKKHIPPFIAPERLRHLEIEGENSWAWRLYPGTITKPPVGPPIVKGSWPHLADEELPLPAPGLRLEVWFYAKRVERRCVALCGVDGLSDLQKALRPVFSNLVGGGKYAGRYRLLDREGLERYPSTSGIQRLSGVDDDKFIKIISQMIIDTYPPVQEVVEGWDKGGEGRQRYEEVVKAVDPLARLKAQYR